MTGKKPYARSWATAIGYLAAVLVIALASVIHFKVVPNYRPSVIIASIILIVACIHVPHLIRREGQEE